MIYCLQFDHMVLHKYINNKNNTLLVQYPMQISELLATHVQQHVVQVNGGSTNTTVIASHALLLPSKP